MDELRLERRERDGHGRGHGRIEGRHRDGQGHGGRQDRERPGDGRGLAEAADDHLLQAGFLMEDREGELQGLLGRAEDRQRRRTGEVVRRLVQSHGPGHRGR